MPYKHISKDPNYYKEYAERNRETLREYQKAYRERKKE